MDVNTCARCGATAIYADGLCLYCYDLLFDDVEEDDDDEDLEDDDEDFADVMENEVDEEGA